MVKYIKWLKVIIGIFVFVNLFIFLGLIFQEILIFRSHSVSDNYKYKILVPHSEFLWKDTIQGEVHQLHNIIYTPRESNRYYIFFLHGSKENVEYQTQYVPFFTESGYTVWMMDYRGFGKSRGGRNEKVLYEDASIMFDSFVHKYQLQPQQVIIVGNELGAAIASNLAVKKSTNKLLLISPFNSLNGLLHEFMPWFPFPLFLNYSFPTEKYLEEYKGQIGIFYGSNDMFIPHRNAKRLQSILKPGDEFHEYNTNSGKKVVDEPDFQNDVKLFLKK